MKATMQPSSETHSATASRYGSASDANISWHSANTAKTYQALSLFANLRANLGSARAATPSSAPSISTNAAATSTNGVTTRRASASDTHAHTPRTAPRSADDGVQLTGSPSQKQHPSSSTILNSTYRAALTSSASSDTTAPLMYTDAEISSMSVAQLRRQLKVASAVTQRLHRRTQQLQREVEEWKRKCADQMQKNEQQPQLKQTSEGCEGSGTNESEYKTEGIIAALRTAERRAEELQREVHQLASDKDVLTKQLHEGHQRHRQGGEKGTTLPLLLHQAPSSRSPSAHNEGRGGASSQPSALDEVAGGHENELYLLRDTVRQLQYRLAASEQRTQQATQLQLDALLQRCAPASGQHPPAAALVSAEVQKMLRLMQEQLVTNAVQQLAERARMNELFYQLERRRGLM